jgi:cysteine synthase A
LKQHYPNLKVFAVEPEASQLLVEVILLHTYTGIGAGFIPVNLHIDGTIQVSKDKPLPMHKEQLKKEGMLVSSGHHW